MYSCKECKKRATLVSKKEKLRNKLFSTPPPKSFSWEELITLMAHAGFSNHCDGGSHYTFEHSGGLRVGMSKTHPSGILKGYQVKAARDALNSVEGITGEQDDCK
jgi:predicted RNA binding protein YcfA (HicA-like mRNA interferase family)